MENEQEKIIDPVLDAPVTVCVVHTLSGEHSEETVKVRDTKRFVESCVETYKDLDSNTTDKDFTIILIRFERNKFSIATLKEIINADEDQPQE